MSLSLSNSVLLDGEPSGIFSNSDSILKFKHYTNSKTRKSAEISLIALNQTLYSEIAVLNGPVHQIDLKSVYSKLSNGGIVEIRFLFAGDETLKRNIFFEPLNTLDVNIDTFYDVYEP